MSGRRSRTKGATYERELAARWRDSGLWPDARRGIGQARSGGEVPDVDGTPYWIEAKRRRRVSPIAALEQAERAAAEAEDERTPIAVCRLDGSAPHDAVVVLRLGDWERLHRAQREGYDAP